MQNWGTSLESLAARRGGLVLTRDLVAAGLTDDEIRWATRSLHRIRSGAYSLQDPATPLERHRLLTRAVVHRHHQVVAASHISAAVLHGLPMWAVPLDVAHVTGIRGVHRGFRHKAHTHEGPLAGTEVVELNSIQVTTVPRTVLDCARWLPLQQAVAATDYALHHNLVDKAALSRRLESMPPVTGVAHARRVVALADARAESVGESRNRLILVQGGIDVEPQAVICDGDGRFIARSDFRVKGRNVVGEFDGRGKYLIGNDVERAHWEEKRRHDALNDAGFVVVRYTWSELENPRAVVAKMRAAMTRAAKISA